jgi:NADP-dependent 3-hydroxy acid dehydrogenase YdfG
VNGAGIWTDESLEQEKPERRLWALETNVLGHINFTYAVLPTFHKKNAGYIFNVISTAGASDTPSGNNVLWKTYGASKWAMSGFTKALREDLAETKIRVTAFHPGGFESMLYEKAGRPNPHNQPWMMKTADVADIVIFVLTRPDDVMMERIVVSKVM